MNQTLDFFASKVYGVFPYFIIPGVAENTYPGL